MKPRLFTPGPTPVPEETLLELARPVTYHRAPEAKAILAEVSEDLKYVYQTANPVFTLTCSGTGGSSYGEASISVTTPDASNGGRKSGGGDLTFGSFCCLLALSARRSLSSRRSHLL